MRLRTHKKKQKGQTIVEFAVVFPILFMTIGGIIDMTLFSMSTFALNTATYMSAREIAISGNLSSGRAQIMARFTINRVLHKRLCYKLIMPGLVRVRIYAIPTVKPHGISTYTNPVHVVSIKTMYFYKPLFPISGILFAGRIIPLNSACRLPLEYPGEAGEMS